MKITRLVNWFTLLFLFYGLNVVASTNIVFPIINGQLQSSLNAGHTNSITNIAGITFADGTSQTTAGGGGGSNSVASTNGSATGLSVSGMSVTSSYSNSANGYYTGVNYFGGQTTQAGLFVYADNGPSYIPYIDGSDHMVPLTVGSGLLQSGGTLTTNGNIQTIAGGGTGQTTASAALTALTGVSSNQGNVFFDSSGSSIYSANSSSIVVNGGVNPVTFTNNIGSFIIGNRNAFISFVKNTIDSGIAATENSKITNAATSFIFSTDLGQIINAAYAFVGGSGSTTSINGGNNVGILASWDSVMGGNPGDIVETGSPGTQSGNSGTNNAYNLLLGCADDYMTNCYNTQLIGFNGDYGVQSGLYASINTALGVSLPTGTATSVFSNLVNVTILGGQAANALSLIAPFNGGLGFYAPQIAGGASTLLPASGSSNKVWASYTMYAPNFSPTANSASACYITNATAGGSFTQIINSHSGLLAGKLTMTDISTFTVSSGGKFFDVFCPNANINTNTVLLTEISWTNSAPPATSAAARAMESSVKFVVTATNTISLINNSSTTLSSFSATWLVQWLGMQMPN